LTAAEFRAAKDALGLSWSRLAAVLGYAHGQTVRHFADGSRPVPHQVALIMAILRKLPAARKIAGI
jgi:hypothetical protein